MSATEAVVAPSRLLPRDILRVGAIGLMGRRLRAALSVRALITAAAIITGIAYFGSKRKAT